VGCLWEGQETLYGWKFVYMDKFTENFLKNSFINIGFRIAQYPPTGILMKILLMIVAGEMGFANVSINKREFPVYSFKRCH
jgi:hypothetical protein